MSEFKSGDAVITSSGARATFIKLIDPARAIIRLSIDTQIVNPVTIRKAD